MSLAFSLRAPCVRSHPPSLVCKQIAVVEQDIASLKQELASVRLEVEARAEGAMAREATLRA